MALVLTPEHIKCMQTHAEQAYPHEGCGLLVGNFDAATEEKTLVHVALMDNAWAPDIADELAERGQGDASSSMTKSRRYWIAPQDLLHTQRDARGKGLSIIGVYHSHPNAEAVPSGCDRDLAWPTYAYIIISVRNGIAADIQNWHLDANEHFQPEPMKIAPASAAKDRMPLLSS